MPLRSCSGRPTKLFRRDWIRVACTSESRYVGRVDPTVTILVLISAGLHPLWNLLLKGNEHPESIFLTVLGATIVLGFIHALATGSSLLTLQEIWPLVLFSGLSVGVHGFMLVLALRRGDLSVYYPIIRSAPLGVVAISYVFFGQTYDLVLLVGVSLVLLGAIFLQIRAGARLLSDPLTLVFSIGAMLSSAIYSIVDAAAVQRVEPVVMFVGQSVIALPIFALLLCARQKYVSGPGASALAASWLSSPWRHLWAGSIAYVSYFLILWAYQLGGNVAAVTSVRQASIPISVVGAALLLKEPSMGRRLCWASVLAVGIVVIVTSD